MKALMMSVLALAGAAAVLHADPVIKFDDLPGDNLPVPTGYHLLGWTNLTYRDGVHYFQNPSGLSNGVVSADNVVYGGEGFPGAISGGMFDFLSAYLTAAANDGLTFEAKGYIKGTLVYDKTNTLSATSSTFIQFNFYGVDTVVLTSSGGILHGGYPNLGALFVMDNLTVKTYAPLPFIENGGFETGDFTGWNRTGTTNSTLVSGGSFVHLGAFGAAMGPTNFGSLGQLISPTQIGQTYTVSFFLRNNSAGSNSFNVYWDGTDHPVGFTNQAAFTYTNFHFDVVATRPYENLTFQFLNVPSFFGLDDVSVTYPQFVTNGGFETGDFSGWTLSGVTNQNTVINAGARVGISQARFGAAGGPCYISQTVTTVPGQTYLLSAWLNSAGGTPNEYHASWDGQSLVDQTNLTSFGWTNLHYTVLSGDSQNTLQFGLRNDPSYLFLDEVSVLPVPILQNGGFEFGDFSGWTQSGNTGATTVGTNAIGVNSGFYGARFGPVGSLGFISQTVPTVPGQTYLIGFILNNPTPMTNAEFKLTWNGAVLMDTTNLSLTNFLHYEFAVPASGTNSTVQFGFRDDPATAYLGFDDVYITPVPAPEFQSIIKTNSNVYLSWSALPDYLYQLQFRTNLTQGNWSIVQDLSKATNFPMTVTDTNPPEPQRFYRVLLASPPLIF